MINIGCEYNIKEDIGFILETERINDKSNPPAMLGRME